MRAQLLRWSRSFLLLTGCAALAGTATADPPTARKLIEQAIAAQGGLKALETVKATIVATKGTLSVIRPDDSTFRAEISTKYPSQLRLSMNVETGGVRIPYIDVLNIDRAWNRDDQNTEELTGPRLIEMRLEAYVNYVTSLVPLVKEEGFSLSAEGHLQVNNAAADLVLVRMKGKPEVRLFFDAQTHFLVKSEHKHIDPMTGKEARFEAFLQDYRVVDSLAGDRKILADAKIDAGAAALRDFLGKQSLNAEERKRALGLIKALGDDKFARREEAKDKLIKMGPRVRGLLEEASRSSDVEIATRAREGLQSLGKGPSSEVLGAVARLLSNNRDPETVDTLVAYLPSAADEGVAKEIRAALAAVASREPKAREKLTELSKTAEPGLRKAIAALLDPASDSAAHRVFPVGVKYPMKGTFLRDGKKLMESEVTEVRFFSSLPISLFSKP